MKLNNEIVSVDIFFCIDVDWDLIGHVNCFSENLKFRDGIYKIEPCGWYDRNFFRI